MTLAGVNKICLRIGTEKYSDKTLYLNNRTREESDSLITTPREIPMTTAALAKIFAIENCSHAIRFAIIPWQIPLENNQTAFPFDLWNY